MATVPAAATLPQKAGSGASGIVITVGWNEAPSRNTAAMAASSRPGAVPSPLRTRATTLGGAGADADATALPPLPLPLLGLGTIDAPSARVATGTGVVDAVVGWTR